MKPVTPEELSEAPERSFPDEVIEAFNQLIRENYRNGGARFTFKQAASRIADRMRVPLSYVYVEKMLDVEEAFRKAGWQVVMDKPGYNESYEGYWVFSKPRGGS